jgi:starch synthase
VARLATQKGLDLLSTSLPRVVRARPDVRVVVLGTGDRAIERDLKALADAFPKHVAVDLRFDDDAARRIEAGSDFFLMPSRFEPCRD